jgi:ribosomal protein S18 acetylase RimI-like enzyme
MMSKDKFHIRRLDVSDRDWVKSIIEKYWGSELVVTKGVVHDASKLPGYIAILNDIRAGLITYRIEGDECEIVTMNSLKENIGVGSALIEAVKNKAINSYCRRIWLITTNDNLHALGFYQKRGFVLKAVYPDAVKISRRLKEEIPIFGNDNIPVRDEIELEMILKE